MALIASVSKMAFKSKSASWVSHSTFVSKPNERADGGQGDAPAAAFSMFSEYK